MAATDVGDDQEVTIGDYVVDAPRRRRGVVAAGLCLTLLLIATLLFLRRGSSDEIPYGRPLLSAIVG